MPSRRSEFNSQNPQNVVERVDSFRLFSDCHCVPRCHGMCTQVARTDKRTPHARLCTCTHTHTPRMRTYTCNKVFALHSNNWVFCDSIFEEMQVECKPLGAFLQHLGHHLHSIQSHREGWRPSPYLLLFHDPPPTPEGAVSRSADSPRRRRPFLPSPTRADGICILTYCDCSHPGNGAPVSNSRMKVSPVPSKIRNKADLIFNCSR